MADFYLVTGFLGAGKTTFLKGFLRWLAPQRIRLIVNEFGKIGVDGTLLAELGAAVNEINNGSIFCSCRLDQFENALDEALADPLPPDVIVVEASGLSDPTAIRRILSSPAYSGVRYRGAICLVDATSFHKIISTAAVSAKQLSVANLVLVNKTDAAEPALVQDALDTIADRFPYAEAHETAYGRFEPEWLAALDAPALDSASEKDGDVPVNDRDITLQKCTAVISEKMSVGQLERFLRIAAAETYRIKGFVRLEDGAFHVDCVGAHVEIKEMKETGEPPESLNRLACLAGRGMQLRKTLKIAAEWYPGLVAVEF